MLIAAFGSPAQKDPQRLHQLHLSLLAISREAGDRRACAGRRWRHCWLLGTRGSTQPVEFLLAPGQRTRPGALACIRTSAMYQWSSVPCSPLACGHSSDTPYLPNPLTLADPFSPGYSATIATPVTTRRFQTHCPPSILPAAFTFPSSGTRLRPCQPGRLSRRRRA